MLSYYANFPELGQTTFGNWAAMLGLLNVVFRPLGGYIADVVYRKTNSVWAKKICAFDFIMVDGSMFEEEQNITYVKSVVDRARKGDYG